MAENSGGAHCLKYGFTTNHVTGLKGVSGDGTPFEIGEGTGPARLRPPRRLHRLRGHARHRHRDHREARPKAGDGRHAARRVREHRAAGTAVSAVIASGVLPAAIEMMDALAIEAVEVAVAELPEGPARS